mmetsp:Transcript_16588/g.32018  ORF Transcript_16588/g.32018 Transcript_16588/m.32018 type:complete len:453 (-) Transcript_16588:258-1616(-)
MVASLALAHSGRSRVAALKESKRVDDADDKRLRRAWAEWDTNLAANVWGPVAIIVLLFVLAAGSLVSWDGSLDPQGRIGQEIRNKVSMVNVRMKNGTSVLPIIPIPTWQHEAVDNISTQVEAKWDENSFVGRVLGRVQALADPGHTRAAPHTSDLPESAQDVVSGDLASAVEQVSRALPTMAGVETFSKFADSSVGKREGDVEPESNLATQAGMGRGAVAGLGRIKVSRGKGAAKRPSVAAGSSNSSTYTDITQSGESGADSAGVVDESASPLRAGTGWPRRSHRDAWTGATRASKSKLRQETARHAQPRLAGDSRSLPGRGEASGLVDTHSSGWDDGVADEARERSREQAPLEAAGADAEVARGVSEDALSLDLEGGGIASGAGASADAALFVPPVSGLRGKGKGGTRDRGRGPARTRFQPARKLLHEDKRLARETEIRHPRMDSERSKTH